MLYFSQRALNEIDDAQLSISTTTARSISKIVGVSHTRQTTLDRPGASDKVAFALRRTRRTRQVHGTTRELSGCGSVFDLTVPDLKIGVMPFLKFGDQGELRQARVRTFWAQALVPRRRFRQSPPRELILVGSLDNVVNESWLEREGELKIGHKFPSDPSVLSQLIKDELRLSGPAVDEDVDSVAIWEVFSAGCYARFASEQTRRAAGHEYSGLSAQRWALTWERPRPPLRKARVVGIVHEVGSGTILARPVLIQDLT